MLGLIAGTLLVFWGMDGAHTQKGARATALALLAPLGMALVGLSLLYVCVPGFYRF
jgi:hypothetical protein